MPQSAVRGGKTGTRMLFVPSVQAFWVPPPPTPHPPNRLESPLAYVAHWRKPSFLPCALQGTRIWFLRKLLGVAVEVVNASAGK